MILSDDNSAAVGRGDEMSDPMTTETAEMFLRRAERAEAEVERLKRAGTEAVRLGAESRRAAEAERDAYKALILEALDYPAAGTPAGWGRRARSVLAGVVSTREKDDERPT